MSLSQSEADFSQQSKADFFRQSDAAEKLLIRQIEAILFVGVDGVLAGDVAEATSRTTAAVRKTLEKMASYYPAEHGMEIVELGGKWYMTTAADLSDTLEKFRAANESGHVRLTRASLETLAVIAYSQPVTRSEIESIRGVRCDRVIDTLLNYGLVRIAGRRKSTGSPLLYRTTPHFLKIFGLGAISDLPTVAELEELRRNRAEPSEESISNPDSSGSGADLAPGLPVLKEENKEELLKGEPDDAPE